MSNEKQSQPALRFTDFTGSWENKKLGEVVEFFSGLTYSPSDVTNRNGTLVLRSSNVKNGQLLFEDNVYVKSSVVNCNNVKTGDIAVVVRNGSRALIGKHAPVLNYLPNTVIGAFMTGIRTEQSSHINALLDTQRFSKEVEKNLGATINQITTGTFKEMEFYFSTLEQEKSQIGNFFQNIDKQLKLHQSKLDKLQHLKKAMLDKMFPKAGAKVPEVRFAGFSGDWVKHNFLNTVEKIIDFRGRTPKKLGMDWSDSGYLALSALNVKDGYLDKTIDAHYGNGKLYNKWMQGSELHFNQVLFTTEAPMGNVAQVPDNNKYILSQRTIAFEVHQHLITENFLAVLLRTELVYRKLVALSSGGTAQGVSQKSLTKLDIKIPLDLSEQDKIGDYFQNIERLIVLQQKHIDKLKNIKQACLDKMFV